MKSPKNIIFVIIILLNSSSCISSKTSNTDLQLGEYSYYYDPTMYTILEIRKNQKFLYIEIVDFVTMAGYKVKGQWKIKRRKLILTPNPNEKPYIRTFRKFRMPTKYRIGKDTIIPQNGTIRVKLTYREDK